MSREDTIGRLRPGDFLDEMVLPAIFERLDIVFPEFGWKPKDAGWIATNYEFTKQRLGAAARRVICNRPSGFLIYGGDATSWTAWENGGAPPTGRDFVEVIKRLAKKADVDPTPLEQRSWSPTDHQRLAERERRRALFETFLSTARNELQGGTKKALTARAYLEERGLLAYLETTELGLYTTHGEVLRQLQNAGFTQEEIESAHLDHDGRWEGRVLIPWRDPWGHLTTFAARDVTGKAEAGAKYLYLKGAKKPDFFGLDVALRDQERPGRLNNSSQPLVVVEGLLDVVSIQARGFSAIAAFGGSGRGRIQAIGHLGRRRVRSVILLPDNDEEGRRAVLELASSLGQIRDVTNTPAVYIVDPAELGDAKDPDELVRNTDLAELHKVLQRAQGAGIYQGYTLLNELTPASSELVRRQAVEQIFEFLSNLSGVQSILDEEDLLRLTAQRTGYTLEGLREVERRHLERRHREAQHQGMERLLRTGLDALQTQPVNAQHLSVSISDELSALQARTIHGPPSFSVDRLDRESALMSTGRASGWGPIDEMDVRFGAGELALVAARTGHGKTTFLVCLLLNWLRAAERAREDALYVLYSSEEPEIRIYHRLLSLLTTEEVDSNQGDRAWTRRQVRSFLRNPRDHEQTWPSSPQILHAAKARLRAWEDRLQIVYRPEWTAQEIANHVKEIADRRPLGAVMVDYLQRIPAPPGRHERRDIEISAINRTFKSLSVSLAAPMIVAAQIGRGAIPDSERLKLSNATYEKALDKLKARRPQVHHLREGGGEQEPDLILGLMNYRADYQEEISREATLPESTRLEVGTLKNREGIVGQWGRLAFVGRYGLIREPLTSDEI